jgi:hypothetical protein
MGTIRSHSSGRAAGCKPTLHAETPCNPRETNTRPYDSIFGLIMFLPTEHFKHELQEARVRMHWPHYSHSGGYLKHYVHAVGYRFGTWVCLSSTLRSSQDDYCNNQTQITGFGQSTTRELDCSSTRQQLLIFHPILLNFSTKGLKYILSRSPSYFTARLPNEIRHRYSNVVELQNAGADCSHLCLPLLIIGLFPNYFQKHLIHSSCPNTIELQSHVLFILLRHKNNAPTPLLLLCSSTLVILSSP